MSDRSCVGEMPPSEKIVLGFVGVGWMGNQTLRGFAKEPDVEIAALCDVDKEHLESTREALAELRPGMSVDTYTDYRRLLERDDIDAIVTIDRVIATSTKKKILAVISGKGIFFRSAI